MTPCHVYTAFRWPSPPSQPLSSLCLSTPSFPPRMSLKGFIVLLLLILKIKSDLGVHLILGDYKMPTYCKNILRKRVKKQHTNISMKVYSFISILGKKKPAALKSWEEEKSFKTIREKDVLSRWFFGSLGNTGFGIWDRVSLYSPGWPDLQIPLPRPSKFWITRLLES